MNYGLTKREKDVLIVSLTADNSTDMKALYKMHYTRFGSKDSFYFALRKAALIANPSGDRMKPTVRTAHLIKWSDVTNTYRLPLTLRKQFGDEFKDEIRQIMICLEDNLAKIEAERTKAINTLIAAGFNKTEAFEMANIKYKRSKKNLYDQDKSQCQGAVNEEINEVGEDENKISV